MWEKKKPLITAVFLAVALLGAEAGLRVSESAEAIVLGGPSGASDPNYIVFDGLGAVRGRSFVGGGETVTFPAPFSETPVLQAALKSEGRFYADKAEPKEEIKTGLPSYPNYFSQPATGLNWGKLHNNNAVDIANSCGTAVRAAAEGVVMADKNFVGDDWNGGYGNLVFIEHPNGTRTRYAHLQEINVKIGEYVDKKQKIGTMGNTGNSTGCHLHFEIEGARNPFSR